MISISRFINGISLNPLEHLLDNNGEVMLFSSKERAKEFLRSKGVTDENQLEDWFIYEDEVGMR